MTRHEETPEPTPEERLAEIDPAPRESLADLPTHAAREELREQIVATGAPGAREPGATPPTPLRRRLVPVLAAAAVAAVAGGVWWATAGDDPDPNPAAGPSGGTSASSPPEPSGSPSATATQAESPKSSASGGPKERYAMPARPLILTAPGWAPDQVFRDEVTWAGPDGATVEVTWFFYRASEDPFSVDGYPAGEEIDALEVPTRLTTDKRGGTLHQIAITSPVLPDGTGVLLDGTGLTKAEFVDVLDSAEWVDLTTYDKVVKPAVG